MRYVKTYEEYSFFSSVILSVQIGLWIGLLFWKYVVLPSKKKNSTLGDLKDTSWWRAMKLRRIGSTKIEIVRAKYNSHDEVVFEIDTESRRIRFNSEYEILRVDITISKKEMSTLLKRLDIYEEHPEDVLNIFQDIKDEGYKIDLENVNFEMSKFTITLEKEGRQYGIFHRDRKNIISKKPVKEVVDMCRMIEEAVDRIEDKYNVKLVNKIPVTISINDHKLVIYKIDERLKLKLIKTDGGLLKDNTQGGDIIWDVDFDSLNEVPEEMYMTFEKAGMNFKFGI